MNFIKTIFKILICSVLLFTASCKKEIEPMMPIISTIVVDRVTNENGMLHFRDWGAFNEIVDELRAKEQECNKTSIDQEQNGEKSLNDTIYSRYWFCCLE